MTKSAKEILEASLFSALVESLAAIRKDNVDNAVIREIKAIHGNSTFADLPDSVKRAIRASVDATLTRLAAEGYTVSSRP